MSLRQSLPWPPLLLISDAGQAPRPLVEQIEGALEAGCRWLLLREKQLDRVALCALAIDVGAKARANQAQLLLSGDPDLAAELGLAGVHLPAAADPAAARRRLGSQALIGASAHSLAEAQAAAKAGADYVTLSPIFASPSKPGYGPVLGLEGLCRIADSLPIPVIALAGITPKQIPGCLAAGAAGVAVMGEIMRAQDPIGATRGFLAAM